LLQRCVLSARTVCKGNHASIVCCRPACLTDRLTDWQVLCCCSTVSSTGALSLLGVLESLCCT
jgi:hypothetical protein